MRKYGKASIQPWIKEFLDTEGHLQVKVIIMPRGFRKFAKRHLLEVVLPANEN